MADRSERVARALSRLDRTQRYVHADTPKAVYLYLLCAARRHGRFEPFTDQEAELNAWLTRVQAGKALVDDAWDAFARDAGADGARNGSLTANSSPAS